MKVAFIAAISETPTTIEIGNQIANISNRLAVVDKGKRFEILKNPMRFDTNLHHYMIEGPRILHIVSNRMRPDVFQYDAKRKQSPISNMALSIYLKRYIAHIDLIVMTGCYSSGFGKAISAFGTTVLGMNFRLHEPQVEQLIKEVYSPIAKKGFKGARFVEKLGRLKHTGLGIWKETDIWHNGEMVETPTPT